MSLPTVTSTPGSVPSNDLRVLVVADEPALTDLLGSHLTHDGYEVSITCDGREAITQAHQSDLDVMVLCLDLPSIDGVEVCRQVRTFSDCYIIMLTGRTDVTDKVIGLSAGADDYLTMPWSPRELLARIRALLRRPRTAGQQPTQEGSPRVFGALKIDVAGRRVELGGNAVALTRTEFDLLEVLSGRPAAVFSRRQLVDAVWDQTWAGSEHLVDAHVAHLRRKLGDDPSKARYVHTVRGVGYRIGKGTKAADLPLDTRPRAAQPLR